MKTFTKKTGQHLFQLSGSCARNEEKKTQLQLSQINISHLIVMKSEGEGKKEKNNIPAAHFLSLTLSITAGRQHGRERVSQMIRPAGTVNTARVSQRSCVLSV